MGFVCRRMLAALLLAALWCVASEAQQDKAPTTRPATGPAKVGKVPHLEFDLKAKQIRVEAETLGVDMPLEFFAVVYNGPEHEAVIRSKVKPSDLHTALLAVGLQPGAPVSYSKSLEKWIPPHGPPLQIHMEYEKDGKKISEPANRWMRNLKTKKPMPTTTWIFAGSRVMNDGKYAADATGYLVSVVNFDMTVIDIPDIASASNETLEWERNPDTVPPAGTKVTMVIEPAGKHEAAPADAKKEAAAREADQNLAAPAAVTTRPSLRAGVDEEISDVKLDEEVVARATKKWEQIVGPKAKGLREAAQAHYDAINALRKEQQRLIDEADRIQRAIDRLERQYQDMTTPQPDLGGSAGNAPARPDDAVAPPIER
jgi:hypothetical protein